VCYKGFEFRVTNARTALGSVYGTKQRAMVGPVARNSGIVNQRDNVTVVTTFDEIHGLIGS